jgi:hypothetical protein
MHQRQVKAEEVNDQTLRLRAPNLPTYELTVEPAGGVDWNLALCQVPAEEGGPRTLCSQAAGAYASAEAAWDAAYELYRQYVIV